VDETAKKKLKVRVMMQAMLYGLREVAKEDAGVQGQFRGWDRTIQYTVAPDGPHMHIVVADGEVTVTPGVNDKVRRRSSSPISTPRSRSSRESSTVKRPSCRGRSSSPATSPTP